MADYYSKQLKDIEVNLTFHKAQIDLHQTNIDKYKREVEFQEEQVELHLNHLVWFKSEKDRIEDRLIKIDKMKDSNTFTDKVFRQVAKIFI